MATIPRIGYHHGVKAAIHVLRGVLLAALILSPFACGDDPVSTSLPASTSDDYTPTLLLSRFTPEAVVGRSLNDAYVGGRMVFKYDGMAWKPIAFPPIYSVERLWQTIDGTLWAFSDDFFRFDGETWSRQDCPWAQDAYVAYNGELFAFQQYQEPAGLAHWFDGRKWHSESPAGADYNMIAIGGSGPDNVYIVGDYGFMAHFDGANWTSQFVDSSVTFRDVAVGKGGNVFMIDSGNVLKWDGTTLQTIFDRNGPYASRIVSSPDGALYAVIEDYSSDTFEAVKWDAGAWTTIGTSNQRIRDICVIDDQSVMIVDNTGVKVWADASSEETLTPTPSNKYYFSALWATQEHGVYAAGQAVIRYYNGTVTDLKKEAASSSSVYAIHGRNPSDLFAVGYDLILHYDGEGWKHEYGANGRDVVAVQATENVVAAIAYPFDILERIDGAWQVAHKATGSYLYALSGWNNGMVAATSSGILVRGTGGWNAIESPGVSDITDVWADGPDNIYVCAYDASEILHFNGQRWNTIPFQGAAAGQGLARSITSSGGDIFVSTQGGTIMHYTNQEWSVWPRYTSDSYLLSAVSSSEVYSAGPNGLMLYKRPGRF